MAKRLGVISHIKYYWRHQSTGALFIRLSNGKLLQVFFVEGELKSVVCHGMTGIEALKKLASFAVVRSQFYDGAVSRAFNDFPATEQVIRLLGGHVDGPSSDVPGRVTIDADKQLAIENVFLDYVGPIAGLVFREEVANCRSVAELVKKLSRHIETPHEQTRFQRDIDAALSE